MSASSDTFQAKFLLLQRNYMGTLGGHLETLGQLEEAQHDPARLQECWSSTERVAHSLAGTGTTFGFPKISEQAKTIENGLRGSEAPEPAQLAKALSLLSQMCRDAVEDFEERSAGAEAPEPETVAVPAAEGMASKYSVLILDDDKSVHSVFSGTMSNDYRFLSAYNVEQAVGVIQNVKPDLLIVDYYIQEGQTGVGAVRLLTERGLDSDTPVIMITASNDSATVLEALSVGVRDYIVKPINIADVEIKISRILKNANTRVLIVDDDKPVRDILNFRFNSAGFHVDLAENGSVAWEAIQTTRHDLILLDCMMPGYDGVTLYRLIQSRDDRQDIPVVFLTAISYGDGISEDVATGVADYITKPFDPDEVVARCRRILQRAAQ